VWFFNCVLSLHKSPWCIARVLGRQHPWARSGKKLSRLKVKHLFCNQLRSWTNRKLFFSQYMWSHPIAVEALVLTAYLLGLWVQVSLRHECLPPIAVLWKQRHGDGSTPLPRSPARCQKTKFRNIRKTQPVFFKNSSATIIERHVKFSSSSAPHHENLRRNGLYLRAFCQLLH
jgi:hypothetical protein